MGIIITLGAWESFIIRELFSLIALEAAFLSLHRGHWGYIVDFLKTLWLVVPECCKLVCGRNGFIVLNDITSLAIGEVLLYNFL